ncbi:MAG: ABC transporter ATP-binding protein [Lentisphaerae bacterium]|nr:ABC transporter ATP-binding protein [Lentisphaerota bacterium]
MKYRKNSGMRIVTPTLKEQWGFFKFALAPFKYKFALVMLMLILVLAASCASPVVQKYLVDAFGSKNRHGVIFFGVIAAAALVIWRGGEALWSLMASMLKINCEAHLKRKFFRHLLRLPLGVVEAGGSGYLGQRLHWDIELVTLFFCHGIFGLALNFLKLCSAVVLLSICAPDMMLASGPVLLLFFVLTWVFRRRQYELSSRINEAAAEYRRNMQNSLDRLTLFKSRSGERLVDRRVGRNLDKVTILRMSRVRWERFYTILLQLLPALWCGAVWYYGACRVLDGSWTLGNLWAVSGYMLLIFTPGKAFFTGLLTKRNSDAALHRLLELQRMLPEKHPNTPESRIKAASGAVTFDGISFAYPGGREVFKDYSLTIADGEHLGIYGPSGGGKSTLGALLLRLYDVSSGEIRLDGRNVKDYSLKALRQSIGYISQSAELFYGTVRENLAHGGGYQDAKIIAALRRSGMGGRLDENPDLLELKIREDGSNFSAGERLKLALARELLRDTRVLVLDETTAALDHDSEKAVFELLRCEWRDRTVIFISHRDFTPGVMDRIVKITPPQY